MRFKRNEKRMTQPLEYLCICMKNDLRKGSTKCLQLRSLTHEQCGTGAWYRGIAGLRDPLVSAGSLPLATQCALMWAYRVVIVLNQDPPRQLIPQDKAATVVKCANTGLINLSLQRNHFCLCPALQSCMSCFWLQFPLASLEAAGAILIDASIWHFRRSRPCSQTISGGDRWRGWGPIHGYRRLSRLVTAD